MGRRGRGRRVRGIIRSKGGIGALLLPQLEKSFLERYKKTYKKINKENSNQFCFRLQGK